LGLAAGDALGAAVEFMSSSEIKNKYGEGGIQDFDEWLISCPLYFTHE
jgi:ADP-ribosylglycohydrolase